MTPPDVPEERFCDIVDHAVELILQGQADFTEECGIGALNHGQGMRAVTCAFVHAIGELQDMIYRLTSK